jgi:hypothetical protein
MEFIYGLEYLGSQLFLLAHLQSMQAVPVNLQ